MIWTDVASRRICVGMKWLVRGPTGGRSEVGLVGETCDGHVMGGWWTNVFSGAYAYDDA